MEIRNIDRILGVIFLLLIISFIFGGVLNAKNFFNIVIILAIGTGLFFWWKSGIKEIPVGSRGQLLFLKERMLVYCSEGKHWAVWPFDFKIADCRSKTTELDPLEVFTKDKIKAKIKKMSIVWQIINLDLYHSLDPKNLNSLLDDVIDKNVRQKIRENNMEDVLGMSLGTENVESTEDLKDFGIKIQKIIVPEVVPADPKILEDLELQKAEEMEKKGQKIEAEHIKNLIVLFTTPDENGNKMELGDAKQLAELITGKANPKNITEFSFPPKIMEVISKIIGGK